MPKGGPVSGLFIFIATGVPLTVKPLHLGGFVR
jgi:hypothetical protein